jgi:predicted dehydrogenase
MSRRESSRRDFLRQSALAGAGLYALNSREASAWIAPKSPNEKVNIACIGVGGKGDSDSSDAGRLGNIVAICDVDERQLSKKAAQFPKAKKYNDYRKMLDEIGGEIDAVTVSTPDHTHAPAAAMAMRMGKHAFVQKPLTWSIHEARVLSTLAAEKKLVTQMGNQGTSHDGLRTGAAILKGGALGKVKEIHCWTNRPIWPQGVAAPKDKPAVPKEVNWDAFLGPAADRPYNPAYHPFAWRGWLDFGTGALGDMACHTLNVAYMGLELVDPISAEIVDTSGIVDNASYPAWSVIKLEFGERNGRAPLTLYWYDGGKALPKEKQFSDELLHGKKRDDSGLLVVGEKGSFYSQNDYGSEYALLGDALKDYQAPKPLYPHSPGHFEEFVQGIHGEGTPVSNFDYAGKLTETVLLGVVALRAGAKIDWDPVNLKAKGNPDADQFIRREYRKGWEL